MYYSGIKIMDQGDVLTETERAFCHKLSERPHGQEVTPGQAYTSGKADYNPGLHTILSWTYQASKQTEKNGLRLNPAAR